MTAASAPRASMFDRPAGTLALAGLNGLLWGVVVGFDPEIYSSNDDLLSLDGEVVDLVVTATDTTGNSATGTTPVTINVGG